MADPSRLTRLVEELTSDVAYARGDRAYDGHISNDDAADIAGALQSEFEAGTAARERQAASIGATIACGVGCTACCDAMILVLYPEAAVVARWLLRPDNAAIREQFLDAYTTWITRTADRGERMATMAAERRHAEFTELHLEHWAACIKCAFNREGLCTIYPVRPLTCRNAHALNTADRCAHATAGGEQVEQLMFKPIDDYLKRARMLIAATHHAMGKPRRKPAPLCTAVFDLLVAAGSGPTAAPDPSRDPISDG